MCRGGGLCAIVVIVLRTMVGAGDGSDSSSVAVVQAADIATIILISIRWHAIARWITSTVE